MKRIAIAILLLLGWARGSPLYAQSPVTGTLGAAATVTCSAPSNAFVVLATTTQTGGVSFTVSANASANTISFFASGDGQNSWFALNVTPSNSTTAVTTTTGTGTWTANAAGYTHVCMEISSFVSGTATVRIQPSSASARAGGGGGGSGTINSCATTNAIGIYTAATTLGCGNGDFTYATDTLSSAAAGIEDLHAATGGDAFILPVNGSVPNTLGSLHWLSGSNFLVLATGNGGGNNNDVVATAHLGTGSSGTNCGGNNVDQFLSAIFGGQNAPVCSSLSNTYNTLQKNETGTADANVLTFTPTAAAATYRACVVISVSAATAGVIAWTLSWTDSNGTAQSNIAQDLFQDGTAAPATTFTTSAAGNYHFCRELDVNNAAAAVVVKWVGGGTTTAKMSAAIERII